MRMTWKIELLENTLNLLATYNQENQDSSGNQKNVIQGQRSNMENRHMKDRT